MSRISSANLIFKVKHVSIRQSQNLPQSYTTIKTNTHDEGHHLPLRPRRKPVRVRPLAIEPELILYECVRACTAVRPVALDQ